MATIPKKVINRFSKEVPSFQKVLASAKDRDVNESDTVTIITDVLADIFGFDKYTELTSEQAIRGTYCDLAVRLDGAIKYLIEVKAIGLPLKDNHIRQAVNYGVNHGIQWVVLTNGVDWEIYRIKFERPVDYELICSLNFLDLNPKRKDDQDRLFLLCKEGLHKAAIEEFHEHVQSVNQYVIGAILQSQPALDLVRREIRKVSPGVKVTTEEIENIIVTQVLKRGIVEGDAAKKAQNQVKRSQAKKSAKKPKAAPKIPPEVPELAVTETSDPTAP